MCVNSSLIINNVVDIIIVVVVVVATTAVDVSSCKLRSAAIRWYRQS